MEFYDFPYIGNVIIPTDELIFFRGVGIPWYTTKPDKMCQRVFLQNRTHQQVHKLHSVAHMLTVPGLTALQVTATVERAVSVLEKAPPADLVSFEAERCLKMFEVFRLDMDKGLGEPLRNWMIFKLSRSFTFTYSWLCLTVWRVFFVSQSEIHHFRDVFVVCSLSNSSIVHFFWMFLDYCWNPVVGLTWLIPWCFLARRRARAAGDQVSSFSKMICCRDIKARETTVLTIHTQEYEFICTHCTP